MMLISGTKSRNRQISTFLTAGVIAILCGCAEPISEQEFQEKHAALEKERRLQDHQPRGKRAEKLVYPQREDEDEPAFD